MSCPFAERTADASLCSLTFWQHLALTLVSMVSPLKQFDYGAVANRLFEMASHQSTPSQNRKRLYKVIRK